jgi:hypothetical protein
MIASNDQMLRPDEPWDLERRSINAGDRGWMEAEYGGCASDEEVGQTTKMDRKTRFLDSSTSTLTD